jgi:hypothetical protein
MKINNRNIENEDYDIQDTDGEGNDVDDLGERIEIWKNGKRGKYEKLELE